MIRGFAVLAMLAGDSPEVRAHADLVVQQLQLRGPQTAQDLAAAVADPRRLGLALAFLRDLGTVVVTGTPGHARLYQLAAGLLPAALPARLVLRQIPELPFLQQLSLDEPARGNA